MVPGGDPAHGVRCDADGRAAPGVRTCGDVAAATRCSAGTRTPDTRRRVGPRPAELPDGGQVLPPSPSSAQTGGRTRRSSTAWSRRTRTSTPWPRPRSGPLHRRPQGERPHHRRPRPEHPRRSTAPAPKAAHRYHSHRARCRCARAPVNPPVSCPCAPHGRRFVQGALRCRTRPPARRDPVRSPP